MIKPMIFALLILTSGFVQAKCSFWQNTKTSEAEYLCEFPADRLDEFLPQTTAAQGLYQTLISQGRDPVEAFVEVSKAFLGIEDN